MNAEFEPDSERVWRWVADRHAPKAVVKFELLADLDDQPAKVTVVFDGCQHLGAVNLRGTGAATRDIVARELRTRVGGVEQRATINVTGLGGYLLAKTAAATSAVHDTVTRDGDGAMPAARRIDQTVDAAIWWPSRASSPVTRR